LILGPIQTRRPQVHKRRTRSAEFREQHGEVGVARYDEPSFTRGRFKDGPMELRLQSDIVNAHAVDTAAPQFLGEAWRQSIVDQLF
jgi:hypothetical protein